MVSLDARGRLNYFQVIPPEANPSPAAVPTADFSLLFQEAGLDPAKWVSVEPIMTPPSYADMRAAWTGVLPDRPEVPMRVEAAAYRGKPVWWNLIYLWELPDPMAPTGPSSGGNAADMIILGLLILVIIGGVLFARRNLRMGRGDKRGAVRLAYFSFVLSAVAWVFWEHHVATFFGELYLFEMFVSWALFVAGLAWLLYISMEPWVRRRWPNVLVGWSRLLAGSFRDPLVRRDLLVGCAVGAMVTLVTSLKSSVASWVGVPQGQPLVGNLDAFLGARAIIKAVADGLVNGLFAALGLMFPFFVLRVLLRREWAAAALFMLIWTVIGTLNPTIGFTSGSLLLSVATAAVVYGALLFVLLRFGLLAFAANHFFSILLTSFPITTQVSAWYSGIGLVGLVLLLGLAGYGFYTSLGGQPLFGRASLED
jgi:hypothetical protein